MCTWPRALVVAILTSPFLNVAAYAQPTGAIAGTILTDSGGPLARAGLWASIHGSMWHATTDSLGRFVFEKIPVGTVSVTLVCPPVGLSLAVPAISLRSIPVFAEHYADASATVGRHACDQPPARDVRVHWRGWYSAGFEESEFTPCPDDPVAREVRSYGDPLHRHAWVTVPEGVWQKAGIRQLEPDTASGLHLGFVEWSGILHGPAPSGHMGVANYSLRVDSIFTRKPQGCE
jgi:hypothetical protein